MKTGPIAIKLNEENFEREVPQKAQPVLVDFKAEWCPPCRAIAPVIEQIAEEFESAASAGTADVDQNSALARRFGIASIPAPLFFKEGKVVDQESYRDAALINSRAPCLMLDPVQHVHQHAYRITR